MKSKYLIPFSFFAFIILFSFNSPQQKSSRNLKKSLDEFAADKALQSASWGFIATQAETGQEIISVNPNLALIPASTQKIVTTLTSLSLLGPDYRFETILQYDGSVRQNGLSGNIYIYGTGDPTLGSAQLHDSLALENVFTQWLGDIKKAGIEKINGHIIADGSYFDDHMIPPKWMWEDIGNYYGAGAHALSVYENMYTVYFQPGRIEGEPAQVIRTEPAIPGMEFINDVTTGPRGSGDKVYIYGVPRQNTRWLTGTVPLGQNNFPVRGSMPDPGYFLAQAFIDFLRNEGITINGEAYTHQTFKETTNFAFRNLISRWESPPVVSIAERTNLSSVNTYAENLLKSLGKIYEDHGSYSKGADVILRFWEENGIDIHGLRIHDGSGLSPYNSITVKQLNDMLIYAAGDRVLFDELTKGFPVAGESGSLNRLFTGTRSQGILMAKSGFLGNVRAYSGYTRSRNGDLIAFTFIVNNYAGDNIQLRNSMVRIMDAVSGI
ncbi:MAG: D-alanyl-D-alanine carboxypeptidase/D-alanyl-D-alanine-endopeptidase [Bacteroidales bacterium]